MVGARLLLFRNHFIPLTARLGGDPGSLFLDGLLECVEVKTGDDGGTLLSFDLENRSRTPVTGAEYRLWVMDFNLDTANTGWAALPEIAAGTRVNVEVPPGAREDGQYALSIRRLPSRKSK